MFGLELHPAVVHFPIALSTVGAVSAVAYLLLRREWLRWFAPVLLSLALLGSGVAYFTGQSAGDRAEKIGVPEKAVDEHEEACLWALGMTGLACLLTWATFPRQRGMWLAALIAVIAAAAMLRTGHLGGKLVFIHGAGHVGAPAAGAGGTPGAPADSGGETGERDGD